MSDVHEKAADWILDTLPGDQWLPDSTQGIVHEEGIALAADLREAGKRCVLPEGRILFKCDRCDGIGGLPPRPGESRYQFCDVCSGTGYWLEDADGSDGLTRRAAADTAESETEGSS